MSIIGKTMRLAWWHENDYVYAACDRHGYRTGTTAIGEAYRFIPDFTVPYDTSVVVLAQVTSSKYSVVFSLDGAQYSAYVRRQWLSPKLTVPKVGDMVRTRQSYLMGQAEIPKEYPEFWRTHKGSVMLRARNTPSPVWLVTNEDRGFLQLNTGTWVSCGDVYVPTQVKKL